MSSLKSMLTTNRTLTAVAVGEATVFVRCLSLTEMRQIDAARERMESDPDKGLNLVKELVALAVCDEQGEPIFDGPGDADLDRIGTDVLVNLAEAATKANNFGGKVLTPSERFELRLALAMGRTRRELRETMDAAEYMDWLAFHQHEPFGGDGEDVRLRVMLAYLLNGFCGSKLAPADIKFEFGPPEQKPKPEMIEVDFATGIQLLGYLPKRKG